MCKKNFYIIFCFSSFSLFFYGSVVLCAIPGLLFSIESHTLRTRSESAEEGGDRSFYAGFYRQSISQYEMALALVSGDRAAMEKVKYKLACAHFLVGNYSEVERIMGDGDHFPDVAREKLLIAEALKCLATAFCLDGAREKVAGARAALQRLLNEEPLFQSLENSGETYYLHAWANAYLEDEQAALTLLEKSLAIQPDGFQADKNRILLGTIWFKKGEFVHAEEMFAVIPQANPQSPLSGEALFWAARCCDHLNKEEKSRQYRRQLLEQYPHSPFAEEANFSYYTYFDYLQGERAAIKHLENFTKAYPQSPFSIYAWYLIGMDHTRDRKTLDGKWIRKKNLSASVEAFQNAENLFDALQEQGLLSSSQIENLTEVRYRAGIEGSLVNLEIAKETEDPKRTICIQYAIESLENLLEILDSSLLPSVACHREEASYWLAMTRLEGGREKDAEALLNEMIEKYAQDKITRGYYLAKAWEAKGKIAFTHQKIEQALHAFTCAEDAAAGKVLSAEHRLHLWIEQSCCYEKLGQLDQAILTLSKVVNEDVVSGVRIQAMYLRAELYEQLGRRELARRQFESTAKKGGEWGAKAAERLKDKWP